jgi:hypothetical protein
VRRFRAAISAEEHEHAAAFSASDADLVANHLGDLLHRSLCRQSTPANPTVP